MQYTTITVARSDQGVTFVTLNRPERMNVLNGKAMEELSDAMLVEDREGSTRVVVLTGSGRAFCAGADFDPPPAFSDDAFESRLYFQRVPQQLIRSLISFSKPLIGMVNGDAIGIGLDVACACDFRIGCEKTRFNFGFTRVGLVAADGGAAILPRIVGLSKAMQMAFTAEFVEPGEAHRIGLLDELVQQSSLKERTMELALKIAIGPQVSIRLNKMLLRAGTNTDFDTSLQLAALCQPMCIKSQDFTEAISAFNEKRKPVFGVK